MGNNEFDTGLDLNNSGNLEDGEVSATTYVCNGADGGEGASGTQGQNSLHLTER